LFSFSAYTEATSPQTAAVALKFGAATTLDADRLINSRVIGISSARYVRTVSAASTAVKAHYKIGAAGAVSTEMRRLQAVPIRVG
jgi:hypothetical protein